MRSFIYFVPSLQVPNPTPTMKASKRRFAFAMAAVVFAVISVQQASGQGLSRWALGRPSVLIDLPDDPRAGAVTWSEQTMYSILPNSWIAETEGVRVEVARIYGRQSATDTFSAIAQKLAAPIAPQNVRDISGRPTVANKSNTRAIAVAGTEPGLSYGTHWAFVFTFSSAAGAALADQIFNSIVIEREGRQNWTLRSLGRTNLSAELPFEMAPDSHRTGSETETRYELNFDGLEIKVLQQEQRSGGRFDADKTINSIIADNKGRPGVTDFVAYRGKTKLGDKQQADLATMTFRRGSRQYKILETVVVSGTTAILASITTDPNLPQHARIADRVFNTLRFTGAVIYGWKPYPVGTTGLYLDLPKAPDPQRIVNGTPTSGVFTGPMAVDVREVASTAYDPEFASRQMLDFMKAWPGHKDVQGTIEKRLIDGLEARLLRTTHKNGSFTNHRHMLLIYSFDRFWAIDAIAAENEKDYLERLINSAAVQLPVPASMKRQQIGQMGVSLVVGPEFLKTEKKETPNDPLFASDETAGTSLGAGALIVAEMTYKHDAPRADNAVGMEAVNGLLRGVSSSMGMTLTAKLRDSFPVNLGGTEGLHFILDVTVGTRTVQGDFLILTEGRRWWTTFVLSDAGRLESRSARSQVVNSIRIGR